MINLLPPNNQLVVRAEYRQRLGRACLLILIVLEMITFLLTATAVGTLVIRTRTLESLEAKMPATTIVPSPAVQAAQLALRTRATRLEELFKKRKEVFPIIKTLATLRPAGAKINELALNRRPDGDLAVTIRGVATTRNDFLTMLTLLKDQAQYFEIDSPISNLVNKTAAPYDISFTVSDKKTLAKQKNG